VARLYCESMTWRWFTVTPIQSRIETVLASSEHGTVCADTDRQASTVLEKRLDLFQQTREFAL